MWLATKHGFYSIVQKAPGEFHVRARVRKDLENLLTLVDRALEIQDWPSADYRYRIIVAQRDLSEIMAVLALSLDYPNFKNQIARLPDQRIKLDAFHEIWAILANMQKGNEQ
jgi:hypothetical protein